MSNIYDQIVASAYYVFGDQLTTKIIASFLVYSTHNGNHFEEQELKLDKLKGIIKFENHIFKLNPGYSVSDIADCINFDMVEFFLNIKCSRDKYYSTYEEKRRVMIKRKVLENKE